MSIKIENVVTPSPEQWEAAIRGMRNPMNSWEKSDSRLGCNGATCKACGLERDWCGLEFYFQLGPNDLDLMQRLCNAGSEHRKFLRMLPVIMDITAPLYYWKEADQYRVGGTTTNSTSTMHKIHAKEFTLEDFSCEHLSKVSLTVLNTTIEQLNWCRESYLKSKDKGCWWQMIQLLPSSYNQKRTLYLNYETLRAMYHQRKNHKLDEWRSFCDFIETLPCSELITETKGEKINESK